MIQWWDSLEPILKTLYCISIPATLVLVIQTILSILGGADSGAGIDGSDTSALSDFGSDGSFSQGDFDFSDGTPSSFGDTAPSMGELADAGDVADSFSQTFTDGGNPADFSVLRLFTVQGVVAFLTVFGWTSIATIHSGAAPWISLLLGIVFGLLAMFAVAKLIQLSSKLTENGTVDMKHAVGDTANVYLPIPPKKTGEGKITMYLQCRYVECPAVTDGENTLATGTVVRIVDFRNGLLVVEEEK